MQNCANSPIGFLANLRRTHFSKGKGQKNKDVKICETKPFYPSTVIPAKAGIHRNKFMTYNPTLIGSRLRGNDNFFSKSKTKSFRIRQNIILGVGQNPSPDASVAGRCGSAISITAEPLHSPINRGIRILPYPQNFVVGVRLVRQQKKFKNRKRSHLRKPGTG